MQSAGNSKSCLELLKHVGKLKHLQRTGWVRSGVPHPETVSGHMYRMAIAAMMFDKTDQVDANRVLRLCLIHDLAESIVGDITPHCGVTVEDKFQQELNAMTALSALPPIVAGEEMLALFKEYEDQQTAESQLVKDLDKFDMLLQAFEYEKAENKPGWLDEFFKSTGGIFKHPRVLKWAEELYQQRTEFSSSIDHNTSSAVSGGNSNKTDIRQTAAKVTSCCQV